MVSGNRSIRSRASSSSEGRWKVIVISFFLDQFDVITNATEELRGTVNRGVYQPTNSVIELVSTKDFTFDEDTISVTSFDMVKSDHLAFNIAGSLTIQVSTEVTLGKIKRTNSITNLNHLLSPVFRGLSPPDIYIIPHF
jgi:hypothetical protein